MPRMALPLLASASIRNRVHLALDTVAQRLERPLPPGDVHQLRRAIKQLRAWCRLLESDGQPGAKRLKRSLSELAAHYSTARDAKVQFDTIKALERDSGCSFAHCKRLLQAAVPALAAAPPAQDCTQYRDTLRLLAGLLDSALPSPAALQRGLKRSRRKAARCSHQAWYSLDTEDLHELRKAVKSLAGQYALCVDRRGSTGSLHRHLVSLGNRLGSCHDLAVLRDAVALHQGGAAQRKEVELLTALTTSMEQDLWPECMALSEECFPGKVR
jgi:CHAD domain-containing protein